MQIVGDGQAHGFREIAVDELNGRAELLERLKVRPMLEAWANDALDKHGALMRCGDGSFIGFSFRGRDEHNGIFRL